MIVRKCSLCGDAQAEPLVWTVFSWTQLDGSRTALKHRLCVECSATILAPLHVACERPVMLCPHCGIGTDDNYDAVYGTFVPKGVGTMRFEAPFCPPCAAHFRERVSPGGQPLPDRTPEDRTQLSPRRASAEDTWAALGIVPRAR